MTKHKYRIVEMNNGNFYIEFKPDVFFSCMYGWDRLRGENFLSLDQAIAVVKRIIDTDQADWALTKGYQRKRTVRTIKWR